MELARRLRDALTSKDWRHTFIVRDNATTMSCLIALEERTLEVEHAAARDSGTEPPTMCSIECGGHSCVLCMKPMYEAMEGLPSNLVTLAHCLENGKTFSEYQDAIKKVLSEENGFQYREVARLPPEAAAWRAKTAQVLQLTRTGLDLTTKDEELILDSINGDPDNLTVCHFCVRGRCPLGCAGSAVRSRRLIGDVLVMAVGGRIPTPLLYRWKNFERAAAIAYRGRRLHDVTRRALNHVFKAKDILSAENEAQRQLLLGQPVDHKTEGLVRGGKVVKFVNNDDGGQKLMKAIMLCKPLQAHLNRCFAAETAVHDYVQLVLQ